MPHTEGLLEVGRIGRAHGIKGAVYVSLTSDRDERLAPGARLFDGRTWLVVVSARPQPQRKWVVQFEGLSDRNAAELLTGREVFAAPLDDDDALWVHHLIGARVVDADGVERGTCISVLDNPAHDILELDSGHLVPVTFVVSLVDGVVTVNTPDGLFDLLD
ncbi:MAG: ribosome maturation factor RimM [Actinomycetota bacterium]|jgi:16S rRNA processing protein RimM